jgi:hypothetical protein
MNLKPALFLTVLLILFYLPLPAWSGSEIHLSRPPLRLLVFESQNCTECHEVNTALDTLQKETTQGQFSIDRYILESPEAKDAFTQHQVTTLPNYILVTPDQEPVFEMSGTIDPERLLWTVREALGKNETLEIPEPLQRTVETVGDASDAPMVLMFWAYNDPDGQLLVEQMMESQAELPSPLPNVFSFNTHNPEVRSWLDRLGISEGPAYLIVSPKGSIFRKSSPKAKPWQLAVDLNAYAMQSGSHTPSVISDSQTIPVHLTSPKQDDALIHPATMPPQSKPASDEMFHP